MDYPHFPRNEVVAFWQWFEVACSKFQPAALDSARINELESRLKRLGDFDWEIGPGGKQKFMLSFSPKGDARLLLFLRTVVDHAPILNDWEFHAGKPARKWDISFSIESGGQSKFVDGKSWQVVVYRFPDGVCDLVFMAPTSPDLSQQEKDLAASIIVDGELGESQRMEMVNVIEVVTEWPDQRAKSSASYLSPGLLRELVGLR
jgi:hypothetical protein